MEQSLAAKSPAQTRRVAIWFDGPQEVDPAAFIFFVLSTNDLQKSLFFLFPDLPDDDPKAKPTEIQNLTYKLAAQRSREGSQISQIEADCHIFITKAQLGEEDYFFIEEGSLVLVTTYKWDREFAPPSLFEYLFHCILCGVTYRLAAFHSHDQFTIGCPFDFTCTKANRRAGIVLGRICDDHARQVRERIGPDYFEDIQKLFSFEWIGKADEANSIAYKMRDYFRYDLKRDSGFQKSFWERTQPHLDTLWFDFGKELFKGLVLILIAYLLFKFGLKKPDGG